MTGLEMMFSKMIGLSPEQLREMANQFVATVQSIDARLKDIQEKVRDLHNDAFPVSVDLIGEDNDK